MIGVSAVKILCRRDNSKVSRLEFFPPPHKTNLPNDSMKSDLQPFTLIDIAKFAFTALGIRLFSFEIEK